MVAATSRPAWSDDVQPGLSMLPMAAARDRSRAAAASRCCWSCRARQPSFWLVTKPPRPHGGATGGGGGALPGLSLGCGTGRGELGPTFSSTGCGALVSPGSRAASSASAAAAAAALTAKLTRQGAGGFAPASSPSRKVAASSASTLWTSAMQAATLPPLLG